MFGHLFLVKYSRREKFYSLFLQRDQSDFTVQYFFTVVILRRSIRTFEARLHYLFFFVVAMSSKDQQGARRDAQRGSSRSRPAGRKTRVETQGNGMDEFHM